MARKKPYLDQLTLNRRAAGRCSFPDCKIELTLETKPNKFRQIGKIAHIVGHSPKGPRGDSSFPSEKLATYQNWILLCGTHHDIIDADESKYSVEKLHEMKKNHESWVRESLDKELMEFGFAELEVAASAILASSSSTNGDSFTVTPPLQKMKKNNLTKPTHKLLTMGLCRSPEVGKYIEEQSKLDAGYPERLKGGFRKEYDRLVSEKLLSDDLFESMLEFASGNSNDFKRKAAGLSILAHLFEICEVFEQ